MFGQFIANSVQFFIQRRLVFLLVFGGVLAFLIVGLNRLKIEEDLYAVFPDGKEYQEFSEVLQRNNLNKQVVFSVDVLEDDIFLQQEFEPLAACQTIVDSHITEEMITIIPIQIVGRDLPRQPFIGLTQQGQCRSAQRPGITQSIGPVTKTPAQTARQRQEQTRARFIQSLSLFEIIPASLIDQLGTAASGFP